MCDEKKKSSYSSSKCAYAVIVAGSIAVIGLAVASAAIMASARQCTIYAARQFTVAYTDFSPFVFVQQAALHYHLFAINVFLYA
jgi:hypothetical protein